ncbi:MAG: UTP--glucose-1-phosphate uridylyltransferase [Spirochaetales bacterium]|nr:UTP--glucose-1-phosphate uridylyltransferase [Spirochaetales bacterium]
MKDRKNLISLMKQQQIDADEAFSILDAFNEGRIGNELPLKVTDIPGKDCITDTGQESFIFSKDEISAFEDEYRIHLSAKKEADGTFSLSSSALRSAGNHLVPYVAFGVLNGGSATSYADSKKNKAFNKGYFESNRALFETIAETVSGKAKGITPAFINPDGSPGPSFLELKIRAALIQRAEYQVRTGTVTENNLFQMTSITNDDDIKEAMSSYTASPFLADLARFVSFDISSVKTACQPLIAAYTQEPRGSREIFIGKDGFPLPLPGGHGQNFKVLKNIYAALESEGKKLAQLGNIDNLGNMPDPLGLALTAIKKPDSAFEFSFKTSVDIKGGILVKDQNGRLNCGDIGVAVSTEEVQRAEESGKPVLFNCATGIFCLEYLNSSINRIIETLPVRFSNQDKDAGTYSQAEQVTWEIIGLLDNPLILGVDKYERFIAAKILMESFLASGIGFENIPLSETGFLEVGHLLRKGLKELLKRVYRLELQGGKWVPVPLEGIMKGIKKGLSE